MATNSSARQARARFVPPEPPRTPKSAATRRHLLQVAGELFIDRGYDAVSLRDIAKRADLTKSAIYGHFRSKGALLVEVIRWKLAEREHDPAFRARVEDPQLGVGLLVEQTARDIRVLEVDAAAAARHDPDIASGMALFYEERDRAIRAAFADARRPDVVAFVLAALSAGVGMKEAVGVQVPAEGPWSEVVAGMVASVYPPDRSPNDT